jgi:alanine racemase
MRPIQATISTSALAHNLNLTKQTAPNAKVMAVVKANGYGHGLFNVVGGLAAADGFAVLGLNEAIDLREAGFEQTILLLEGVFEAAELNIATSYRIEIVVHHQYQVEMLQQVRLIAPINVHLKMNTGMNRLGFKPSEYADVYQMLRRCENVAEITLMTHFASADETVGIEKPLSLFVQSTIGLEGYRSLANSATILRYPEAHADWVRPGIMLYGATPVASESASVFGLKPVMQLTSEIISVQTIEAGEGVGYGAMFIANKPMRIGVVACGYADGYPRHAPNGTPIAVAGKLTHTLGRVSMDMLCCDLSALPHIGVGASVELWGELVAVDTVAKSAGTIGYELLCALAPRVPTKVVA